MSLDKDNVKDMAKIMSLQSEDGECDLIGLGGLEGMDGFEPAFSEFEPSAKRYQERNSVDATIQELGLEDLRQRSEQEPSAASAPSSGQHSLHHLLGNTDSKDEEDVTASNSSAPATKSKQTLSALAVQLPMPSARTESQSLKLPGKEAKPLPSKDAAEPAVLLSPGPLQAAGAPSRSTSGRATLGLASSVAMETLSTSARSGQSRATLTLASQGESSMQQTSRNAGARSTLLTGEEAPPGWQRPADEKVAPVQSSRSGNRGSVLAMPAVAGKGGNSAVSGEPGEEVQEVMEKRKSFLQNDAEDLQAKLALRFGADQFANLQGGSSFRGGGGDPKTERQGSRGSILRPGVTFEASSSSTFVEKIHAVRQFIDDYLIELRITLWLFLEEPFATRASTILSGSMVGFIFLAMGHSMHNWQPATFDDFSPWTVFELCCNIAFSFEVFLRFWSFPLRRRFLFQLYNIIDICAVLPFWINEVFRLHEHWHILRVLSTFEAFGRLLKLCRYFWGWHLLFHALKDSVFALIIPLFFLFIIVVFGSSLLLSFEERQEEATIRSLFDAVHYAVVCVVSIGVGEVYNLEPVSGAGRFVALFLMTFGVMFMAMPIAIVGTCFSQTWFDQDRILLLDKVRGRIQQQGFTIDNLYEVFTEVDEDDSGQIEFLEFKKLIDTFHLGLNIAKIRTLFNFFDQDGDGAISYQDFVSALYPESVEAQMELFYEMQEDHSSEEESDEDEEDSDEDEDEESDDDDEEDSSQNLGPSINIYGASVKLAKLKEDVTSDEEGTEQDEKQGAASSSQIRPNGHTGTIGELGEEQEKAKTERSSVELTDKSKRASVESTSKTKRSSASSASSSSVPLQQYRVDSNTRKAKKAERGSVSSNRGSVSSNRESVSSNKEGGSALEDTQCNILISGAKVQSDGTSSVNADCSFTVERTASGTKESDRELKHHSKFDAADSNSSNRKESRSRKASMASNLGGSCTAQGFLGGSRPVHNNAKSSQSRSNSIFSVSQPLDDTPLHDPATGSSGPKSVSRRSALGQSFGKQMSVDKTRGSLLGNGLSAEAQQNPGAVALALLERISTSQQRSEEVLERLLYALTSGNDRSRGPGGGPRNESALGGGLAALGIFGGSKPAPKIQIKGASASPSAEPKIRPTDQESCVRQGKSAKKNLLKKKRSLSFSRHDEYNANNHLGPPQLPATVKHLSLESSSSVSDGNRREGEDSMTLSDSPREIPVAVSARFSIESRLEGDPADFIPSCQMPLSLTVDGFDHAANVPLPAPITADLAQCLTKQETLILPYNDNEAAVSDPGCDLETPSSRGVTDPCSSEAPPNDEASSSQVRQNDKGVEIEESE